MSFSQFELEKPLNLGASQRQTATESHTSKSANGISSVPASMAQTITFENETPSSVERTFTAKAKAKASKTRVPKFSQGLNQTSDKPPLYGTTLPLLPPKVPIGLEMLDENTRPRATSELPISRTNDETPGPVLLTKEVNIAKPVVGKSRKRKAKSGETAEVSKTPKEKKTKFKSWDDTKKSNVVKAAALKAQKDQDARNVLLAAKALSETQNQSLKKSKVVPTSSVPTTIFRVSRPILTRAPLDVWRDIFAQCPLDFLIKAREVCRDFRIALSSEVSWKKARIKNYGPDCPDPPSGMTEMQYADLLTGCGCQSKGCSGKARKTYWAFQRRWCDRCLKKRVIMCSSLVAINERYPRLLECIHHASFDIWDDYIFTGTYDIRANWIRRQTKKVGYERLAISKVVDEIDGLLESYPTEDAKDVEERDSWYRTKAAARDELVKTLQKIETWVEEHKVEQHGDRGAAKSKRAKFYDEKAWAMIPPMEPRVLRLCPSYKKAMTLVSKLNDRNWKTLQAKLEAEREAAEEYRSELDAAEEAALDGPQSWREQMEANHLRAQIAEPAVALIKKLATIVTDRLNIGQKDSAVADPDIIPIVLREVYREYRQLDNSRKPKIDGNPYQPSIQDSRSVYQEIIKPRIGLLKDALRIEAARTLKCPLCKRKDVTSRFEYDGLLLHISSKHATMIAGFEAWRPRKTSFATQAMLFAWDRIPWPTNLPISAMHHTATGKWDLNEDIEYMALPPPVNYLVVYQDAFANRKASSTLGRVNTEFIENIIYAAKQFRTGSFPSMFIAQVSFQFALHKYRLTTERGPELAIWRPLHLALLRTGLDDLFDGFQCQFCHDGEHHSKNNKFLNKGQPFAELMHHYEVEYYHRHPIDQWTTRSMRFPSSMQLYTALHEEDKEDALHVFDRLFPITHDSSKHS